MHPCPFKTCSWSPTILQNEDSLKLAPGSHSLSNGGCSITALAGRSLEWLGCCIPSLPHWAVDRAGLRILVAGWLVFSVTLGQAPVFALGSLSDRQDWCWKQQLSGYHLLNYCYTNHSYIALQNVDKQDLLCFPIHFSGWEEDQGPFRELGKFRKKKKCHTNSLETQNGIQISLHLLAPGHIFSLVSLLAPLKL